MTTDDFIKLHMDESFRLMRKKSITGQTDAEINERVEQLVIAQRHMVCCWALEATEADLELWVRTFSPERDY